MGPNCQRIRFTKWFERKKKVIFNCLRKNKFSKTISRRGSRCVDTKHGSKGELNGGTTTPTGLLSNQTLLVPSTAGRRLSSPNLAPMSNSSSRRGSFVATLGLVGLILKFKIRYFLTPLKRHNTTNNKQRSQKRARNCCESGAKRSDHCCFWGKKRNWV